MSNKEKQQQERRKRRGPGAGGNAPVTARVMTQALKDQVERWAEEACEAHDLELIDVEFATAGRWIIRVYAQRPGNPGPGEGITIDECALVSRYLEALCDAEEQMMESYLLEVSSPGIERPLKRGKHYDQVVGSKARLVLREPHEGQSALEGVVRGYDAERDEVKLERAGAEVAIPLAHIKKANVMYDFGDASQE